LKQRVDTVILIHVPTEWRTTNRRYAFRALAETLPDHAAVICANRPVGLVVTPLKRPRKFWTGIWRTRIQQVTGRLHVVTPRLVLHEILAARVPGLNPVNRRLMARQLTHVIGELYPGARRLIQWIHHPMQRWVFDALPLAGKVYHCYDEYTCSPDGVFKLERWEVERQLLREADITFATSETLAVRRRPLARRLEPLPNGMPAFFLEPPVVTADPIDQIPHPRVGYIGNVFSLLDYGLLEAVFSRRRDWQLVFIGPVEKEANVKRLRRLPNVHFLGRRPHESLPGMMARLDVGIMPFVVHDFSRPLSPLKLFEYLGGGLPVVSTDLPELRVMNHLIRLVPNQPQAFETAITETLGQDRPSAARDLQAAAAAHTWEAVNRRYVVPVLREVFGF
jgi:glycosyltransferase involved in cell wall biosynthesis